MPNHSMIISSFCSISQWYVNASFVCKFILPGCGVLDQIWSLVNASNIEPVLYEVWYMYVFKYEWRENQNTLSQCVYIYIYIHLLLYLSTIYIYYTYSCDFTHTDGYLTHTIIMNNYIINCKIKCNHALKIFRVSKVENNNCVSKFSNII